MSRLLLFKTYRPKRKTVYCTSCDSYGSAGLKINLSDCTSSEVENFNSNYQATVCKKCHGRLLELTFKNSTKIDHTLDFICKYDQLDLFYNLISNKNIVIKPYKPNLSDTQNNRFNANLTFRIVENYAERILQAVCHINPDMAMDIILDVFIEYRPERYLLDMCILINFANLKKVKSAIFNRIMDIYTAQYDIIDQYHFDHISKMIDLAS